MKSDTRIISYINQLIINELTAINQYFLHAKMFKHWGLTRLNSVEHQEYVEEMKHADCYIERVLFLEGLPNLQNIGQLNIGKDVEESLKYDLKLELKSTQDLRNSITYAHSIHDYVSWNLMVNILNNEEKHIDFLEKELWLISHLGIQNYLQSQLKDSS